MCSISGIINVVTRNAVSGVDAVERMNRALHHRGPDDRGIEHIPVQRASSNASLVLGNTRLAIIDTSAAGHQPMMDPMSGNWISYNGETYNFRDLRREIGSEFGPWRSNTDTEVVLRAYRKWGVKAFSRLRGMFALALWDAEKSELILARDEFGIKPLYYAIENGTKGSHIKQVAQANSLIFASEVRALLASGMVPRRLSREGVASFLQFGSVGAPRTIVDGVFSLMPGEVLRATVRADALLVHSSNSVRYKTQEQVPKTRAAAIARLRSELEESVNAHLVSDVPLGVFLSGGMDSSALVALMSRVTKQQPKTFSVVFDDQDFSEAPHSRLVSQKFQTEHCEVHLSENRLLEMLPRAIGSLDQPTMDGVNTYVVSRAVKDAGLTVALSGLGGDELFAGYPTFRRALRAGSLNRIQRRLLQSVSSAGKVAFNGSVRRRKFWELAATNCGPADVYRITRELFSHEDIEAFMPGSPVVGEFIRKHSNSPTDIVNEISRLELQGYMANTLLRDTDSVSMANSLEVRVPFVDSRVAEYVLSLPGAWKLNGQNGKRPKALLAEALGDLLPADFLMRPKMGFTLPFEKWMQSALKDDISEMLSGDHVSKVNLRVTEVSKVWQKFLETPGAVGWSRPWALFVLTSWCNLNDVTN